MLIERSGNWNRTRRPVRTGALLALLGLAGGVAGFHARTVAEETKPETHDIAQYLTKVDDIEAAFHVTKYAPEELEKIGSEFKTTYAIHNLTLQYKQPDKLRLEGKSPTRGTALMILNGPTRYFSVPKFRIRHTDDLTNTPGKRQSLLEYGGLLTPNTLTFMEGHFVDEETLDGHPALVFDMTYQRAGGQKSEGGPHYRLWIDPKTHITQKRTWYDGDNKLRATFTYLEPKEVAPGFWLPGRVEIKNAEGVTAAEVTISDARINQKLPDSLFEITRSDPSS